MPPGRHVVHNLYEIDAGVRAEPPSISPARTRWDALWAAPGCESASSAWWAPAAEGELADPPCAR